MICDTENNQFGTCGWLELASKKNIINLILNIIYIDIDMYFVGVLSHSTVC